MAASGLSNGALLKLWLSVLAVLVVGIGGIRLSIAHFEGRRGVTPLAVATTPPNAAADEAPARLVADAAAAEAPARPVAATVPAVQPDQPAQAPAEVAALPAPAEDTPDFGPKGAPQAATAAADMSIDATASPPNSAPMASEMASAPSASGDADAHEQATPVSVLPLPSEHERTTARRSTTVRRSTMRRWSGWSHAWERLARFDALSQRGAQLPLNVTGNGG